MKNNRVVLLRFCHENAKSQKYLIGGIEQVINLHKDTLLPKVALIFKALYDLDILDEEVLIEWHAKVSKKYVTKELSTEIHAKAEPFIKWLKEAEEEESSEEEDDVEIEYDDRARITSIVDQRVLGTANKNEKPIDGPSETKDDDEKEFIDIDNI